MSNQQVNGGLTLAVVGTRTFTDAERLARVLGAVRSPIARIVSGGARGADALAEGWARVRGIPVRVHGADWGRYGPMAGPIRNKKIVEEADALVAFWDGRSRGTADVVAKAEAKGIPVHVVRYEPDSWQTDDDDAPPRRCVYLGFEETKEYEPKTPDELAEEGADRAEEEEYHRVRTFETVCTGDVLDSVGLRLLETDHGAKTAIMKRGEDKGPPADAETGERIERRGVRTKNGKNTGAPHPMNPAKEWKTDGEIATVYPPAASGAQLVVLVDGRRIILPRTRRVVRGGPLDRYRHVLRIKGWGVEKPAKDGRGTVLLLGPHTQIVESWIPRFPREAGGGAACAETVTEADRASLDQAARAALPRAA